MEQEPDTNGSCGVDEECCREQNCKPTFSISEKFILFKIYLILDEITLATTNLSSLASSIFPTQLSFKLKAKSMYKTNWTKMNMKPAIKPNTYQTVVNGATVQV